VTMTLDQAITRSEQKADEADEQSYPDCAEEHRQVADWLKELKKWREKRRYPISRPGNAAQRTLRRQSGYGRDLATYMGLLPPQAQEDFLRVLQKFEDEISWMRRQARQFRPF